MNMMMTAMTDHHQQHSTEQQQELSAATEDTNNTSSLSLSSTQQHPTLHHQQEQQGSAITTPTLHPSPSHPLTATSEAMSIDSEEAAAWDFLGLPRRIKSNNTNNIESTPSLISSDAPLSSTPQNHQLSISDTATILSAKDAPFASPTKVQASSNTSKLTPTSFKDFPSLEAKNSLSHHISWSVANERGYRNLLSPYPNRHPIHTEIEDLHWPTLQERAVWEAGMTAMESQYKARDASGSSELGGAGAATAGSSTLIGMQERMPSFRQGTAGQGLFGMDELGLRKMDRLTDFDAMDEREGSMNDMMEEVEDGGPVDLAQTTRIMVLADGHGGVGAAKFFVPRMRVAMHNLMRLKEWNFDLLSHQDEFRHRASEVFKDLDSEYVADKVASYRRWRHDIILNTNDEFDGDNPSRKHKMTRPPDDGCTLVVTVIHGAYLVNLNVGDSRTALASRPALGTVTDEDDAAQRDMVDEDEDDGSFVSGVNARPRSMSVTTQETNHPMAVSSLLQPPSPVPSGGSTSSQAPLSSSSSYASTSSLLAAPPPPTLAANSFSPSWPSDLNVPSSDNGGDLEWRVDFSSSDHNMTHPGKVWSIHTRGGRFINPDGTPRHIMEPLTAPEDRRFEPYHELRGARIHRPPNDNVRSAGISHRRTLNLTATMGDVLFKVDPPVMTPEPDVTFIKLAQDRDYVLVMATDGVWDHLRSQFLFEADAPPQGVNADHTAFDPDVPGSFLRDLLPPNSALTALVLGPMPPEPTAPLGLREDVGVLPASVLEAFKGRFRARRTCDEDGGNGGMVMMPTMMPNGLMVEGDDIQNAMVLTVVTAAVDLGVREMMEKESEIEAPTPRRGGGEDEETGSGVTSPARAPSPVPSPTPSTSSSVSSSSTAVCPAGVTLVDRLSGAACALVQREGAVTSAMPMRREERMVDSPDALSHEEFGEFVEGLRGRDAFGKAVEGLFHQRQMRYDDATAFVVSLMSRGSLGVVQGKGRR